MHRDRRTVPTTIIPACGATEGTRSLDERNTHIVDWLLDRVPSSSVPAA